ncbi:hypothetical protein X777_00399 [Ooceraea biroi]|uniref:Uncharacterized protein n=1 Tax=Ooceraea biroi TaxID=2015173 RepID=A0A026WV70_OOCBI|nr:hypothetical protein X777_00399 [Ooceraea biroi]
MYSPNMPWNIFNNGHNCSCMCVCFLYDTSRIMKIAIYTINFNYFLFISWYATQMT